MFLYNTLSRRKEKFRPIRGKTVGLYTCGPTVYDSPHIGNLRTFIFEDILRRSLKFNGFKVRQVMNLTDIEDKIIKRAKKERKNFRDITKTYTKVFFEDIQRIGLEKAEVYPKATLHIKEMIQVIGKLLRKGYAYQGRDGSIYFDISKFRRYGALSGLKKRELKAGARIAADEYNKNQAQDFVLWKTKKKGEPFWKSPWGEGRPGWHIECSAMSIKYLGEHFDIHTGGVDLVFPHHENEIAQSEAATGKKFVNFWLEAAHLLVNGKKMSKSLGNFYTLRDIEKRSLSPLSFRYLVLTAHYRTKLDLNWKSLEGAERALINLYHAFSTLRGTKITKRDLEKAKNYRKKFLGALEDDLNTPKALAILWQVLRDNNLSGLSRKRLIIEFDKVLGLKVISYKAKKTAIPKNVMELVKRREKLRANQQFIKADSLRKKIRSLGYKVEDTREGPVVTKAR